VTRAAAALGLVGAAAIGLGALAGCTKQAAPKPCPRIGVLGDASHLVRFKPGSGRDLTDITYEADISVRRGACEYVKKETQLYVELSVEIQAVRAPGTGEKGEFAYFIRTTDRGGRVTGGENFVMTVPFGQDLRRAGGVEELALSFPLKAGQLGSELEIVVGFQLSPDELDYNRRLRGK
jgi:hypothetical protein